MGKKIYDINIIYSNYRQNKYKLVFSYGDIIDKSEVNRKIKTIFIESEGSEIKETIDEGAVAKEVTQVGIRLLKFCQLYDMKRIMDNIQQYADPFQAKFPERDITWRKLTETN
jgi:hypothetical protein